MALMRFQSGSRSRAFRISSIMPVSGAWVGGVATPAYHRQIGTLNREQDRHDAARAGVNVPGAQGGEAVGADGVVHALDSFRGGSLNSTQQICEAL
jgi:hypothetical protein